MKTEHSYKSIQLDSILDKVSLGIELEPREKKFLDNYNSLHEEDFMDFRMLSRFDAANKVENLLDLDFKIICNLCDEDGLIGLMIQTIVRDEDKSYLVLEDCLRVVLEDNTLYDLKYDFRTWQYSLESNSQFMELATINKDYE